jgi:Putative quorum-sensing-regulated virulence factor
VFVMPFGKHRGWPLEDLPDAYVRWLYTLGNLREPLRSHIEAEWRIRFGGTTTPSLPPLPREVVPVAEAIISTGLRALTREHHPDVGGEVSTMQKINHAVTWLRSAVRAA